MTILACTDNLLHAEIVPFLKSYTYHIYDLTKNSIPEICDESTV